MSRKKKIVLSAVLGLVILLVGGLIWGGNYLVTFAIARSTGLKDIAPESTLSDETTQAIIRNWQQQAQQAKGWMAQSTVADSACTLENMMIAANALDLGACWINQLHWLDGNADVRAYMEALGLERDETITGGLILGYGIDGRPVRDALPRTGNPVTWI